MNQYEVLEKILEDETIRNQVRDANDTDEAYRILSENGLDVPKDAFEDLLLAMGEAIDQKICKDELTEEDLDNVAGGAFALTVAGVSIKMTAACAAAFGTGVAIGVGVGVGIGLGYLAYRVVKNNKNKKKK